MTEKDNPQRLSNPREAILDPSVKIEPLVDRWYAWPHLLAPAQQALNLAYRYLPAAKSFVAAPSVHIAAAQNPEMFGGPFLDLPEAAVSQVRAYVAEVESRRSVALRFADQLRAFNIELQRADGYCLDGLRQRLPEDLSGRVELIYDLNSHPKLRLLEEMFMVDDLGLAGAEELLLHRQRDIDRAFFLSTPRIGVPDSLSLRIPFGSEIAKAICDCRHVPIDLVEIAARLEQPIEALAPYFVSPSSGATARARYAGDGVRVRYFGHACLLIETCDICILVDPTMAHDRHGDVPHFTIADLPSRIDILFISHGHQDHFSPEMLMQLRGRVDRVLIPPSNRGELADPSLKGILQRLGYSRIETLEPLDVVGLKNGSITALPFSGEHCDLDVHSKQCAIVELKGRRICLFIDSDAVDPHTYQRLRSLVCNPDIMFLGMECFGAPLSWLYGPLITQPTSTKNDRSRRLSGANCERAWRLTENLQPRRVFVYAMGQEPWMRYVMGLTYPSDSVQVKESGAYIERCRQAGIPAKSLYLTMEEEI
jgi:L-ascorbate metabolism protein UlaG (beta-lactamase superfamily)